MTKEDNFHKWSIARMRNILIRRLFYLKSLMGKGDENIESEVAEVKGYMCQLFRVIQIGIHTNSLKKPR